jgi:hypothetical protein
MRTIALTFVIAVATLPAAAQETAGRYSFEPTENGVMRLDAETGEVSLCSSKDGALSCVRVMSAAGPSAEDTAALRARIAELEARVSALEARPTIGDALPDEEAMDRVADLAERMMRRFFGIVQDMKRESDGESL